MPDSADVARPLNAFTAATAASDVSVILIAPNLSKTMGGEAIKSLQIYLELLAQGVNVRQITHDRVQRELEQSFPTHRFDYIRDSTLDRVLWKSKIGRPLQRMLFQWRAMRLAEKLLAEMPGAIIHVTAPISPVQPHATSRVAPVVLGPLNGNVHYPRAFRAREGALNFVRRVAHGPLQVGHRFLFPGNRRADRILVSGGERSFASLRLAGCDPKRLIASIDSGVDEWIFNAPRVAHVGENFRFVHSGRLVDYKGADLAIRGLAKMRNRTATLDIIGKGPKRGELIALAAQLGVTDRVKFIDWIDHATLVDVMRPYRAFVFPSLAEANGMVVQEAMVMGLPVICVNCGGPAALVTPETGIAIEPTSETFVTDELAKAMDHLGERPDVAERMSIASRQRAIDDGFAWPEIIRRWIAMYREILAKRERRIASK